MLRVLIVIAIALLSLTACASEEPPADTGTDAPPVDTGTADTGAGDATLPNCPGFTPDPMATMCTSAAECAEIGSCYAPGTSCCGTVMVAPRDCESDGDCAGMTVCEEYLAGGACSSGGLGSRCVDDCRMGGDCVDATCDALGHCVPLACPREFTCNPNQDCLPSSSSADAHGCVLRTCEANTECDCGACVNGTCQPGPGTCQADCA